MVPPLSNELYMWVTGCILYMISSGNSWQFKVIHMISVQRSLILGKCTSVFCLYLPESDTLLLETNRFIKSVHSRFLLFSKKKFSYVSNKNIQLRKVRNMSGAGCTKAV